MDTPLYEAIMGVMLSRQREEVVRCRDCIYATGDAIYCTEGCCDESEYRNVEPDGFCKWGERRDG